MRGRPSAGERLSRVAVGRAALLAAGVAAVVVALVALLGGGSDYRIHARYADAGQLVSGDLVEIGGRPIGKVGRIALSDDGQADVELKITDEDATPLRRGTVARIRTVGLSGVANRYVDVAAATSGAEIPDGGVLTTAETRPVVDLDELLNALDRPTRSRLQRLIRDGATIFGGAEQEAAAANRALAYLNPALAQTRALGGDLTRDAASVDRLVASAARVVDALASRRTAVGRSLQNTARTLRAVAGERAALGDTLAQAPGVLRLGRGSLGRLRSTLHEVRPTIRALRPSGPPLAATLRETVPTARVADPVARRLRALLPSLRRGLRGLPALERDGTPALRSTTSTLAAAMEIFAGLRPYAPDFVNGLFGGFGGLASQTYDANGHVTRVVPTVGASSLSGLASALLGGRDVGALGGGYRTGLDARCPGAATNPADDGSNPFVPDEALCDREDGFG